MALQGNPSSYLDREIRMVLVGKTGVGKSETGNTICGAGKEKIFTAMSRPVSVTKKCQHHSFNRFGYDLQLVDGPGFHDTSRSHEDIKHEIKKCVGLSSPGLHAILFIVRIGRFGEEDTTTLEKFLQGFGQEAKRFVIVVFTGKDDMEAGGDTIDNYIGECPKALKQFLSETSLRFIPVNNRGTVKEKDKFTKDLINKVKNMVEENGGQCYTNEMYQRCEADLREAEKNEKLEGKRQEEFEEKRRQETAAWEEQLQSQFDKIQEMEKELKKRTSSNKDKEDQLDERLKAVELKNEEENKRQEEEKKRQKEQKEAEENMRREIEVMKDYQRNLIDQYELKIEELRLEQIRKQIRDKVENDDIGYLGQFWQWSGSWFQ